MKREILARYIMVAGLGIFACPVGAQESLNLLGLGQREEASAEQAPVWHFSLDQAKQIGEAIGIDWNTAPFSVKQFRVGLEVELEHGKRDPQTDVTQDDPLLTGKIALAHLKELSDYYYRLAIMEGEEAYFQELIGTSKP